MRFGEDDGDSEKFDEEDGEEYEDIDGEEDDLCFDADDNKDLID